MKKKKKFKLKKGYVLSGVAAVLIGAGAAVAVQLTDFHPKLIDTVDETPAVETTTTAETTLPVVTSTAETLVSDRQVYTDLPAELTLKTKPRIDVFAKMRADELVTETNGTVLEGEWLSTDELGAQYVKVRVVFQGKIYEKNVKYTVADMTPPIVLNDGTGAQHLVGDVFSIKDYIGYADNYDADVSVTYHGDVDVFQMGIYPLQVTLSDASGNTTSLTVKIRVIDKRTTLSPTQTVSFSDFCKKYAGENRAFGIDVSAWQNEVDFEAVKQAGCSFVILRIANTSKGKIQEDKYFTKNLEAAKAAGLKVGVYFYSTANTEEAMLEQTAWMEEKLAGTQLDFPLVLDWEDFSTFQEYKMSLHDLNHLFDVFAREADRMGYGAMLYSSKEPLQRVWTNEENRPVWLAHYVNQTDYTGDYMVWQATAKGEIDGIKGDTDFDIWFKDAGASDAE